MFAVASSVFVGLVLPHSPEGAIGPWLLFATALGLAPVVGGSFVEWLVGR